MKIAKVVFKPPILVLPVIKELSWIHPQILVRTVNPHVKNVSV